MFFTNNHCLNVSSPRFIYDVSNRFEFQTLCFSRPITGMQWFALTLLALAGASNR